MYIKSQNVFWVSIKGLINGAESFPHLYLVCLVTGFFILIGFQHQKQFFFILIGFRDQKQFFLFKLVFEIRNTISYCTRLLRPETVMFYIFYYL